MDKRSKVYVNPLLRRVDGSGIARFYLEDKEDICFELTPEVLSALELCRTPIPVFAAFDTDSPDWEKVVGRLLELSLLRSGEFAGRGSSGRLARVPSTAFACEYFNPHENSAAIAAGAVVILGACTDAGTFPQYPRGSAQGPEAIRQGSQSLPLRERLTDGRARGWYDHDTEELLLEGASLLDAGNLVHRAGHSLSDYLDDLGQIVKDINLCGSRCALLGGDHSVSLAALRAHQGEGVGVIHFDAHTDLGYIAGPDDINHGNVLRHILNLDHVRHVVTLGLRGIQMNKPAEEKYDFFSLSSMRASPTSELLASLRQDLDYYITVDIDVLDPSVAPATAVPTPDGMSLRELRTAIRALSRGRRIVGVDLVEVQADTGRSPITANAATELLIELMNAVWQSPNTAQLR